MLVKVGYPMGSFDVSLMTIVLVAEGTILKPYGNHTIKLSSEIQRGSL